MEKSIFTEEYVKQILSPFIGKKIRMSHSSNIPFLLESRMENSFQIEINSLGIYYFIQEDFYLKKDLAEKFNGALLSENIYSHSLDNLSKRDEKSLKENSIYSKIVDYMSSELKVSLGVTYFTYIKSIEVEDNSFTINNIKFFIVNH